MNQPLLTIDEVAEHFRVHPRTVKRWVADGRMEAVKTPGGHVRFSPEILSTEGPT